MHEPSDDVYILAWNRSTDEGEVYSAGEFAELNSEGYEAGFVFDSKEEAEAYLEGEG